MKHFNVIFKPGGKRISIHSGSTLLDACGQAGIILNTVCGGKGTCRKCLVRLLPEGKEVLACQHRITGDLTVEIPPQSSFFEHKILTEGAVEQVDIAPTVYKRYAQKDPKKGVYGVAVDIGTTTVVAKLVDMTTGLSLATEAILNPQTRFGDDVISRISYAQTESGLVELHETIVVCIDGLIARLCESASITAGDIYEICAVGNTTMNHLLLKHPVEQLGRAPYAAYSVDASDISPKEIALHTNPEGNVHTVENIAGFVGADTVAVALAVDIASANEMTLIVDIGTNGEIVLGTRDKLLAASCAAGPALEGARIKCGGRAAQGAIEAVVVDDDKDIDIDIIGGVPARSICGSGLIDAVAVMLNLGVIDTTGRFIGTENLASLPPTIANRIVEKDKQPAFILARATQAGGVEVFLTQRDIREVQLAKGAIRTGIMLLQKRLGVEDSDIEKVLLAGAFGNYIRKESALRIGLLPNVPPERIQFVGNAASVGAQMALISDDCRASCQELARRIEYIEIAHEPDFQMVYAESMLF